MQEIASRRAVWVLLFAAALIARLAAGIWWQTRLPPGESFALPDSESYWVLAQTMVRGEPYQFGGPDARIFRTPGYPLLLAGLFFAVGDDPPVMWARGLSAVLGTLAVGCVAWLARQWLDEPAAWVAGWTAALYPGAIAMSVVILSESPFCVLMLTQLGLWGGLARRRDGRWVGLSLGAGWAAGAATLLRPSWILFTPLAAVVQIAGSRRRGWWARTNLVMLAGMAMVMAPWWVRNAQVAGRFVPTTLQVGASLYDGWNPHATGASDMSHVDRLRRELERSERAGGTSGPEPWEVWMDRRLREEAMSWAAANPGRVARLMGVKFARMWSPWPNAAEWSSWPLRLGIAATYAPLLALGVWGAFRSFRGGWPCVLCWLPAVYFTGLHLVFASSIRYRAPAMLPLIVLAAGAVTTWRKRPPPSPETAHER